MREALASDAIVRDALASVPEHVLADDRRAAMRFELMAAARARPRRGTARTRVLFAALAASCAVAAAVAHFALRGDDGATVATVAVAQIELAAGARGESLDGERLYRLYDGAATFDVQPVGAGERFRVVAGDGLVEVRGTRFTVEVRDDVLARVSVAHGRVVVRVGGNVVADLSRDEAWERRVAEPRVEIAEPTVREGRVISQGSEREVESGEPSPRSTADERFERALGVLRGGDAGGAAREFEALLGGRLDAGRRADALYFCARAHFRAGAVDRAEERAAELVSEAPEAWRAPDAALLLAEIAVRRGDGAAALGWLDRAERAGRSDLAPAIARLRQQLP